MPFTKHIALWLLNISKQKGRQPPGLLKKIEFIQSPDTINDFKVDKADFTRQAPLSFSVVVSTILHLFKETIEFNLSKILPQFGIKLTRTATFSAAKFKIKQAFFQALTELVAKQIET